ncbi:expressed unknown protein [Seminavis robusta]|uniref:Uncharacterized protein n=1 Tax=Seminavis robusta TaxID=568900 RepID=A0A9N8E8P0_9STRA|nr:expressed unknown protein [Seminavis robusta]|eukprot:Sro617_g176100.1 n/a (439) ;mRNA; r:28222-30063
MKYTTAATLLLLTQGAYGLFRDQSTKKDPSQSLRKLEEGMVCELDHTLARSADTEVSVYVRSYPGDGEGLFDITVSKQPWAPPGGSVTNPGWCVDYDRFISTGTYSMDIFSAFDSQLHYHNNDPNKRAVDKRENLPNLAWMINNINVGDKINTKVPGYGNRKCKRTINMKDMQGAVWRIIDNNNGESWLGGSNKDCASEWIKNQAMAYGNGYEPDCTDPDELVPLIYVVDTDSGGTNAGTITNQVIMSESKLSSIEGMLDYVEGEWHRASIAGFMVRYKQSSPSVREAAIYVDGPKEKIAFKTFKSFVRIDVDWNESKNYGGSLGLLGSYDHEGARFGRDGKTLIKNFRQFGQEWQVEDSEPRLFHSYEGAVVNRKCVMPPTYTKKATSIRQKRRLAESGMTYEDAEDACNHLKDPEEIKSCVYDVIATQDLSMASAW